MHIKNDESVDAKSHLLIDISAHKSNEVVQTLVFLCEFLLHGLGLSSLCYSREDILDLESPPDLRTHKRDHTELLLNPFNSFFLGVGEDTSLCVYVKRALHLLLNSEHPLLNVVFRLNGYAKFVFFAFLRAHM